MKTVVITGSTRGIGLGMAKEFLKQGYQVVVNGRTEEGVKIAVEALMGGADQDKVFGYVCDVTDFEGMIGLWQESKVHFSKVDIWINNAGLGQRQVSMWELTANEREILIKVNVLGMMNGSHIAVKGMHEQGYGTIYNLEGFGSKGNLRENMAIYDTSKAAVTYFSKALQKEIQTHKLPILVCTLSPGMVMTDMVLKRFESHEEISHVRPIFNIIASKVDEVTPYLVTRILKNKKSGVRIAYSTLFHMIWRMMSAPFLKRDVFS